MTPTDRLEGRPGVCCATEPDLDRDQPQRGIEGHEVDLSLGGALSLREDLPPIPGQPAGDGALRLATGEMARIGHGSVDVRLEVVLVDEWQVGELKIERQLRARQEHPDRGE